MNIDILSQSFIDDTNRLANDIFNYYNGTINTFNKCVLYIDWLHKFDDPDVLGCTKAPNRVFIFPRVIMKESPDENIFTVNLILTIIHELYHADQIIDYLAISSDNKEYVDSIECPVEMLTNAYLYNNMHDIFYRFGIPIIYYRELLQHQLNIYNSQYIYHKRDFYSHIAITLREAIWNQDEFFKLLDFIRCNDITNLDISFNSNVLHVIRDGKHIDVDMYNTFLNNTLFSGDVISHVKDSDNPSDNTCTEVIINGTDCYIIFNKVYASKVMCY